MASTTVDQFKQMFPASATPSKLSAGKVLITVKLEPYWGDNTVDELTTLVNSLDVPGSHLYVTATKSRKVALLSGCVLLLISRSLEKL